MIAWYLPKGKSHLIADNRGAMPLFGFGAKADISYCDTYVRF